MILSDGREARVTELNSQRKLTDEELKEIDPVHQHFERKRIETDIDERLSKMDISEEEREQRKRILMIIEYGVAK